MHRSIALSLRRRAPFVSRTTHQPPTHHPVSAVASKAHNGHQAAQHTSSPVRCSVVRRNLARSSDSGIYHPNPPDPPSSGGSGSFRCLRFALQLQARMRSNLITPESVGRAFRFRARLRQLLSMVRSRELGIDVFDTKRFPVW